MNTNHPFTYSHFHNFIISCNKMEFYFDKDAFILPTKRQNTKSQQLQYISLHNVNFFPGLVISPTEYSERKIDIQPTELLSKNLNIIKYFESLPSFLPIIILAADFCLMTLIWLILLKNLLRFLFAFCLNLISKKENHVYSYGSRLMS